MTARHRLRAWMQREGLSYRQAAPLFGVAWTTVHRIVQGRRVPSLPTVLTIQRVTGIPPEAWAPTAGGRWREAGSRREPKRRVA